eukprot:1120609-Amphidinium_carterae.1
MQRRSERSHRSCAQTRIRAASLASSFLLVWDIPGRSRIAGTMSPNQLVRVICGFGYTNVLHSGLWVALQKE